MNELADRDFKRILLIKPSSPGDIIHALPVLRGLRQRFPNAHLAWMIAKPFVNMLEADPALNEIIPFDRKHYGKLGRNWRSSKDFMKFVRDLRKKKFDLVVDMQGLFRSGFLARSSGAKIRLGFQDAREMAWTFYTHRVPRDDVEKHAAERNLDIGAVLGVDRKRPDFRLAFTEADAARAERLIEQHAEDDGRVIVMAPSTRWQTKCWPVERFGTLAARLRDATGMRTLLVGGPGDKDDGLRAARASDGAAVNVCGETTLRELAATIDRAELVVTADSTPMHLAAGHGRPLVALFGPTNPIRTGPYGRLRDVVRLELDCSPCYLRKLKQCPHNHKCMQDLTIDRVADASLSRLGAREAR